MSGHGLNAGRVQLVGVWRRLRIDAAVENLQVRIEDCTLWMDVKGNE